MYQLQSVTQTYERRGNVVTALDTCDLEIPDGDFVAIVGPSGSGKTTLLSVLGGMMAPTSGDVLLDGESLYDLSIDQRTRLRGEKIGFVFQSFNLVTWMSACENVQIPLMLSGKLASDQRARALELLDRVGLSDRADHLPSELSQGQQQRVALARTLANDPQVILADEPTGNLDADTRQQVMSYLAEFHNDGRTIVMVTHDADTAAFAKRTIRLVSGVTDEVAMADAA
ncbi:MAG: ABC transporter ATP-binding protein [Rubinisphaera brasiliensis]|uniref:ABC transporter ATP-binding protein n=1 Tax=Rubinisphaera TaxID=1649490 RepID=UPI000C0D6ECA|nr:ABC transporter ATP-binding protein [Rubinisphaera sp.]MBV10249.1 ABC transporter [Rubinisphaera sp.]|tara:strand:- start:1331 stop:2014 length:684 start_codon:yes stop_codon:yes gene_type:complete